MSVKEIFTLPNDDPRKTVAVALALCLICSLIVSGTAVSLRPLQEHNAALSVKREILRAAGLYGEGVDVEAVFGSRIETRLVDLETGDYVESIDPATYDQRKAAADPQTSIVLSSEQDLAKIRSRASVAPVYLLKEGDALERVILPVHGYGLWSTMYGLLALAPDAKTVRAVTFYDQRETAGLGGEVANPKWQARWDGKEVIDQDGRPVFRVVKGSVDPNSSTARHEVDGLSGATLTSNGVTNLVRFWMGEDGFGPYLARLRKG